MPASGEARAAADAQRAANAMTNAASRAEGYSVRAERKRKEAMSEPTTAAGRALLDAIPLNVTADGKHWMSGEDAILAIEREAALAERERIRAALLTTLAKTDNWYRKIGLRDALAILDAAPQAEAGT